MNTFTLNTEHNGVEIRFDTKPDIATRGTLKENGFRWHAKKKLWYAKQTPERLELAKSIARGEEIEASELLTGGEVSDGYMGAMRWDGYKSRKHLYGADLSKAIRNDIKAHGIKGATVRVKTYSMGQSITVTVKAAESEFIPFEEWKADKNIYDFAQFGWIIENMDTWNRIDVEKWHDLPEEEKARIFEDNARYSYDAERRTQCAQYTDRLTTLTDELRAKIEKINAIILTYRYDDSNSMVDYFDTNFYYDIEFKTAA